MSYDLGTLLSEAASALERAYAPYSGLKVGAALLTRKGDVFTGCNIENSSYQLTACAEQVALYRAVAAGERDFVAIAVVGEGLETCFPCGACRQVLVEFVPDLEVITGQPGGVIERRSLKELLPDFFILK